MFISYLFILFFLFEQLDNEVLRSGGLKNDTVNEQNRINSLVQESNTVSASGGAALSTAQSNTMTLEAHKMAAESVSVTVKCLTRNSFVKVKS